MQEKEFVVLKNTVLEQLENIFGNNAHPKETCRLSVIIFNQLSEYYQLDSHDLFYLEIASLLHDAGTLFGEKKHHKNSLEYIMNLNLPCEKTDKLIIANIARYHRKAAPSLTHFYFRQLLPHQRYLVTTLSAILRLADAIDRSHTQNIKELDLELTKKNIIFKITPKSDPDNLLACNSFQLEKFGFNKKKSLFEKTFKKKAILKIT